MNYYPAYLRISRSRDYYDDAVSRHYALFLSLTNTTMSKDAKLGGESFYMSEIDNDVPLLPANTDIPADEQPAGSKFVEIGSITTDPKISA